jgi:hypothetical protein
MKTFILITVMAFITACSVGTHQVVTVEPIEEVKAPVIKTASACSDERSCK